MRSEPQELVTRASLEAYVQAQLQAYVTPQNMQTYVKQQLDEYVPAAIAAAVAGDNGTEGSALVSSAQLSDASKG